jgi:hypothetical protein
MKNIHRIGDYIYITDDQRPKAGDWSIYTGNNKLHRCIEDIVRDDFKRVILTTEPGLKATLQIDDEALAWLTTNPDCEYVEVKPLLSNNGKALFGYSILIPTAEPMVHMRSQAQEIFDSFYVALFDSESDKGEEVLVSLLAKKCALVHVQLLLENANYSWNGNLIDWWIMDLKEEIEKL